MSTQLSHWSLPEVIDKIWDHEKKAYRDGSTKAIRIPVVFKPIIGQHGVQEITKRFKYASYYSEIVSSC